MKTYLISYDMPDGDCGCVELPGIMKLLLWILRRIRHISFVRIHVGVDGRYDQMVHGPELKYGGGSDEEM